MRRMALEKLCAALARRAPTSSESWPTLCFRGEPGVERGEPGGEPAGMFLNLRLPGLSWRVLHDRAFLPMLFESVLCSSESFG